MTRVSDVAAVRPGRRGRGRAPVPRSGLASRARGPSTVARSRPSARWSPLGRRHPRLRSPRAPSRTARRRSRSQASVRPDRRRAGPTRPRDSRATESPPTCTPPRPACSTSTSATVPVASSSRGASAAVTSGRGPASFSGNRPLPPSPTRIDRGIPAAEISLVFAGGIHDARSAALVAALAGPLAVRGVENRDPGRHRLPLHPGGRRDRRHRSRLPGRGSSLRIDGAARVRARPPSARQPHAVRRPLRAQSEAGSTAEGARPRKSARPSRA